MDDDEESSSGSESEDEEEETPTKREPVNQVDDLLDFNAMMAPAQKEGQPSVVDDIFSAGPAPAYTASAPQKIDIQSVMSNGRGIIYSDGKLTFEMLTQKQLEEGCLKVIVKEKN